MEYRRWNDILALKTDHGKVIGFHARNLEVAELTEDVWNTMRWELSRPELKEAFEQLQDWNREESEAVAASAPKPENISSLLINVTQVCNLQCVYCAAGKDGTYGRPEKRISVEKTLPQLKILMSRLKTGDDFHVTFIGGEPLLYPEGIRLICDYVSEAAKEKDLAIRFMVTTNGTQFSESTLALLNEFAFHITVSLDGQPEINDKTRLSKGDKGVTARVAEGVGRLMKNRDQIPSVGFRAVLGTYNTQVFKAFEYFTELNADWMDFSFDHECSDSSASLQFEVEMRRTAEAAFRRSGEDGLRKIEFFDKIFTNLDQQKKIWSYCGSGKTLAVIDAKNNLFTCPWAVNDLSLKAASGDNFAVESLQTLTSPLIEANNCQSCWAKHLCGGGCMWAHKKATGHSHSPDPIFCQRMRSLILLAISYYYQARSN
jgi:uncharacterized protein